MKMLLAPLVLALASLAQPTCAEEPVAPPSPSCLRLHQIDASEIIDKQHIVFRMRDGRSYLSTLPRACPGLRRDSAWMHQSPTNEICDLDLITVLNPLGGGFMPGAACGLGPFEPVSPAELAALRAAAKAAREGS